MLEHGKSMAIGKRQPRRWLLLGGVLAAIGAAYSNALNGPFIWDDRALVVESPRVVELQPLSVYFGEVFWTEAPDDEANPVYYRPLVTLTYALDWARSGGDPGAFHVTNLLVHLAVCALFFLLTMRFGGSPWAAACAALLIGLLPRLTECVTWISGRTDLLAGMFVLGGMLVHSSAPRAHGRRLLAAGLLLLALLSKEVAAAGLVALTVLEARRARELPRCARLRRVASNMAFGGAAALVYVGMRVHALAGVPPSARQTIPRPVVEVLAAPLQALGANLLMLLDPLRPRLQIGLLHVIDPVLVAVGVAAAALVLVVAVRIARADWRPEVWAGLALAGVGVGLVLHIAPIRLNVVAADRFLYFPALGLGIALALLCEGLSSHGKRYVAVAALLATPVFGYATYRRNADWSDELRLWRVAVETTRRENVLPWVEYGNALFRRGRFDEANTQWRVALKNAREGERPPLLGNIASALSEQGRYEEARELILSLRDAEPHLALHEYNLGVVEARLLRLDEAEASLGRALSILPDYPLAERALEVVRGARTAFSRLPPEDASEAIALRVERASIDERLGRRNEAEQRWREVLVRPDRSSEQAWRAVRFLLSRGSHDGAEAALRALERTRLADPGEVAELRQERRRREAEGLLFASSGDPGHM